MSAEPVRCKLGFHRWSIWGLVLDGRQHRWCLRCARAQERKMT